MEADPETSAAIRSLVDRTYLALSTPGSDVAAVFGGDDMTVAGSRLGELLYGREEVVGVACGVAAQGRLWVAEHVKVWRRGDVAWAQVLGNVEVDRGSGAEPVPYWTTGVFTLEKDGWRWQYWSGSEPRESPVA